MKSYYRTRITPVDYKKNPEGARRKINSWVERKTENKIKNILSNSLDPLTRLILVNAIYFKGDWANPFEISDTTEMPFFLSGNKSIDVSMMNQTNEFNYGENESLQILELPYVGDKLYMLVILPRKTDGLQDLEEIITNATLEEWTGNLSKKRVDVYLPRFKMTSEFDLKKVLIAMGMEDAFDMNKANFAGMDGNPNWLYIGAVLHKAFIDVSEEGTEAAAATAVIMMMKSEPLKPIIFRADHPFLFMIRDNSTGSILFMGRVSRPD